MNPIIVKKYGGTSLGSVKRIISVAKKIKANHNSNPKMVIVVSAMGSETNNLSALANKITNTPNPRELDMLLSTGEQKSIALLTIALNSLGLKAKSFTSQQSNILTNKTHNYARILDINTKKIKEAIEDDYICVVAGFQGVTSEGDITTLGRGGSDTTAVALAAALRASTCEIYTDVDGVYTTDPNIYSEAKVIGEITYNEMLELSKLGAQVMHPRAVEIAAKFNISLVIKSSFKDTHGTIVHGKENEMENFNIKSITVDENVINLSIDQLPKDPAIAYQIISAINEYDIPIDMVIQNLKKSESNDLSFTIPRENFLQVKEVCHNFLKQYPSAEVNFSQTFAKISLVGLGINNHPEILTKFFKCIAGLGLNIECLTTSQIKISCLIHQKHAESAIKSLHNMFFIDYENSKNTAI